MRYREEDLILDLKNGSKKAFDAIYNMYFKRLYAYCIQYTKSKEKAEEIVQDVFVRLWNIRAEIKQEKTLQSLLFIISKNYLINAYKANINSPIYESYVDYHEALAENSAHYKVEYDDFMELFERALKRLPPTQQRIIRLSKLEHLSNKEVAVKLSLSEQTVKNQLSLGLKELREVLLKAMLIVAILYLYL